MADHIPVLLNEMLEYLQPQDGDIYLDCTFGAGGYSRAILDAADCRLFAIDQDPATKPYAEKLALDFPKRFQFVAGNFENMEALLAKHNIHGVDGIVMDLGVSSMQLDNAERGFSFMHEGPLDMRMGQDGGMDAYNVINESSEETLSDILYHYGEERQSRKIAKAIVNARSEGAITSTAALAAIIRSVIPYSGKIDPATKSFQAIRIYINDELAVLERALMAAKRLLLPDGRLIVISFHALEDRIVKQFFNSESGKLANVSRHMPAIERNDGVADFSLITKKAVKPSITEVEQNIRSRSARLRAAKRNHTSPSYLTIEENV